MKHNFHVFRKVKQLKMQNDFIFVDTESYEEKIDDKTKKLDFQLGSSIIWNRNENKVNSFVFYSVNVFWHQVESSFGVDHRQYIMFAHNTHFDFKMLNGFNYLFKNEWKLINHYVRNRIYILVFRKELMMIENGKEKKIFYTLNVWDTTNYVPFKLKTIGKMLGYPKLDIDFEKCTQKELEVYCLRDTQILFVFISNLIEFLIENDLSRLKATASSLSFNIYRHKFYDFEHKKIVIHDWKSAIRLERESYRGGITDVFRLGYNENVYKTDVNSHYAKAMKDLKVPTKLLFCSHECDKKLIGMNDDLILDDLTDVDYQMISDKLKQIYEHCKNDYGIIANCTVYVPKRYAYILNDFGLGKTSFAWGKFQITLCTPELNFVEKYGKILKIHEISIYKIENIFAEFVDFFYALKQKYHEEGNKVYRQFTKIILLGQYGKWGQKEYVSEELHLEHDFIIENQDIIIDMFLQQKELIENSSMVYLGSINSKELYVIDKKLYLAYNTNNNSKESFVAISAFITSQSRMNLVEYILIAKRENLCYTDTDSLFVNEKGYKNLVDDNCIDDYELGKLKYEGFGHATFYNPKFYDFEDLDSKKLKRKCKGITQNEHTVLVEENEKEVKYLVEQWDKFKADMRKGNFNVQIIRLIPKIMSKVYDKGLIMKDKSIEPFHVSQIKNLAM